MFGLTFEKLLLVALLAAVVIGPRRLPLVAERLADVVRGVRAYTEAARRRAETDYGVPLTAAQWTALDPRRYDPRRVVAEALREPPREAAATGVESTAPASSLPTASPSIGPLRRAAAASGSSGHPRRAAPAAVAVLVAQAQDGRETAVDEAVVHGVDVVDLDGPS